MLLFGKKIHPLNFEYPEKLIQKNGGVELFGKTCRVRVSCSEITSNCTRLSFNNSNIGTGRNHSDGITETFRAGKNIAATRKSAQIASFSTRTNTPPSPGCAIDMTGSGFTARFSSGAILETAKDGLGFNGEQMIFNFKTHEATGFYGFGERSKRFNKNGDSMDFYNVDVCAIFPHSYHRNDFDPAYVSIPLAIIRANGICTGLYIDNPDRLVIDAGQIEPGHLICQSLGGNNDLYLINGPTLRDVVRNFTEITGRAEMPPLWSLGHHQCRWGYKTAAEFQGLKEKFHECDLPVSALWYDIDYMDEYRVFTWDKTDIPNPASLNNSLKKTGIRTVTIIDPGIKLDPGYSVYESGRKHDIFCKTLSGRDYVGRVWPGDSVFPDFTRPEARDWWAGHLSKFITESRIDGVWLDMNEPATGWSSADEMHFDNGRVAHSKYHNQFGHFMARASRQAFDNIDENGRAFLLTRSGFTGTQRYSAIWTGDNSSNWDHLRMSIPCTLNLGLSGIAFNGPDVGGFAGNTEEELIIRWYQLCFLFPFFRNHTSNHTKEQEPWSFGPTCLSRIRNTIYTRYRLLPYLYNCFFEHHLTGDPVLRPMLYEFEGKSFENTDDQFMVGRNILSAPILTDGATANSVVTRGVQRQQRHVTLPDGWWFDLLSGKWIEGGGTIQYAACLDEVPLFIRDGSIIPYYNGKFHNSDIPLNKIELHIFCKERDAAYDYHIDNRETRDYLRGVFNTAKIRANINDGQAVIDIAETGNYKSGTVSFTPVLYGSNASRISITGDKARKTRALKPSTRRWVGTEVAVKA